MKAPYYLFIYFISASAFSQVGIGTTTPNEDLHIVGNIQITGGIRLGGDSTNTNGLSSIGTNGQIIASDGVNARWADPSSVKGILANVYNLIGTNTITVSAGSSQNVPGLSQVITVPSGESRRLLISVLGYAVKTTGTQEASQGAFITLSNGIVVSSGYVSSQNSNFGTGELGNLPTPVSYNSIVDLSPGTHTISVQFKAWFGSQALNIDAFAAGYNGAVSSDTDAIKSRLTILEYTN